MATSGRSIGRRQLLVAVLLTGATALGLVASVGADDGLTIDPPSAVPSTPYEVRVSCGDAPLIYRKNTQDGYVQGTVAPYPTDDLTEVAPSTWQVEVTAGQTDDEYWATCDDASAGTGRFDAESPHLWFGPRPQYIGGERDPKTTVEGTDCPAGTTARVEITSGGITSAHSALIDQYGDWKVNLPVPVGEAEMTIDAACGAVEYATLRATTTVPTDPTVSEPTVTTPTTPTSPGATPQPATASFTG